jgi:hypothetical protein
MSSSLYLHARAIARKLSLSNVPARYEKSLGVFAFYFKYVADLN